MCCIPHWDAWPVSERYVPQPGASSTADTQIAHIPLFLYPFLNTTSKSRPFEYLRLTSLGVIGALVKNDSSEVINFLLTTEIIPLCLRIMETGSELSKTVAIFIVQKILLDDIGLAYICQTYERFYAVGTVLSNMVNQLVEQQTVRLLKHVVRCFLRYVTKTFPIWPPHS
jgi:CCR4-NOT transcription complex subunit 9